MVSAILRPKFRPPPPDRQFSRSIPVPGVLFTSWTTVDIDASLGWIDAADLLSSHAIVAWLAQILGVFIKVGAAVLKADDVVDDQGCARDASR